MTDRERVDQRKRSKSRKLRKAYRELVDQGIRSICATQDRINRRLLRGAYGKQTLLETIYTVYVSWWNGGDADGIRAELVRRLADETIPADAHLLELLIRVALPDVELNVVRTWVDAIRYGEARHIRTFKFRSFLYAMGGLVRCAELYREYVERRREEEEERAREAEEQRQREIEEQQYRMREARQARKRERQLRSIPAGKWGLYD